MKRIISTILLCVLLLGCVMSFASCGKLLMGKYEAELDAGIAGSKTTYEFSVFKYTKTTVTQVLGVDNTTVQEGSFKITENDEGEPIISFTYEVDGVEEISNLSFAQGEENGVKYIKIGGVTFNKVD